MAFPPAHRRARCIASSLALLAAPLACTESPVTWTGQEQPTTVAGPLRLQADGVLVADSLEPVGERLTLPGAVCRGSVRLSRAGGTLFAVWWAPRPDSAAWLVASSTNDDGRQWRAPAAVDTTDRSVSGCRRTPPAIAADSVSGYVHVTYALQAPEGPGLFFSHSMDHGHTFHSPVAILYGERLGRTSVAADGDMVAVGFEDPNSGTPRVGLALSRTMGHIFEDRLLPISGDQGAASRPLTAVRGRRIAVSWEQRASATSAVTRVVRVGTVR